MPSTPPLALISSIAIKTVSFNTVSEMAMVPDRLCKMPTLMVFIDARGRLDRIENVMTPEWLAKVKAEMGKEEVLRMLGPPVAEWTVYFPARRELAWEWRYCNSWSMIARFHVLIDNDTGRVRSTMSFDETGPDGGYLCAR